MSSTWPCQIPETRRRSSRQHQDFSNQESEGERPFTASRRMVNPPEVREPSNSQRARVSAPQGVSTPTIKKGGIQYANAESTQNVEAHFSKKQIATPKHSMPPRASTRNQFHNQTNSSSLWAADSVAGGMQPKQMQVHINVDQERAHAPKQFHSSVRVNNPPGGKTSFTLG